MAVATGFAHKSQATFFGRTCLVVRSWSQALRGGATRCAQTYLRLYPCVARLLSVPPQAAQYLKLPLLVIAQTVVEYLPIANRDASLRFGNDNRLYTSKSNSKKTTGTIRETVKDRRCLGKRARLSERSERLRSPLNCDDKALTTSKRRTSYIA